MSNAPDFDYPRPLQDEEWLVDGVRTKKVDRDGLYEVDVLGRVFSTRYMHKRERRQLKMDMSEKGYYRVQIYHKGRRRRRSVHSLVGEAFIPNPNKHPQINHINSVRHDNRAENLEWTTQKENVIHGWKMGREFTEAQRKSVRKTAQTSSRVKASYEIAAEIRTKAAQGWKTREISERFNLSYPQINKIINMKSWV